MTKAKLGSESAFYYDEKLKRWVDGSVPESERAAAEEAIGAPPVMPAVTTTTNNNNDSGGGGSVSTQAPPVSSASGTGSPRSAGGIRSRYVDVFARDGMTTTTMTTGGAAPVANVNAFIPSAAAIGGFNGVGNGAVGGPPAPGGMNFFVPAPKAPEDVEGETDSMREPLMLMQTAPSASETTAEESGVVNASEADGGSAAVTQTSVTHQTDDASVARATTDEPPFSADDTPAAFGGGEEDHGATSWVDPEGESARWDAGGDAALQTGDGLVARQPQWQAEDPMGEPAPQWETQTEQWLQQAPSEYADAAGQEEQLAEPGVGTVEGGEDGRRVESAQATTTTTQTTDGAWYGYEGHEDYEYDPRWKFDEATGEWYWDGGDDDEWIERAKHDAALAELQTRLDSRAVELDEALSSRDALANELAQVRESKDAEIGELSSRIADLETRAAEPSTAVVDEAAVDDAYRRGKEDGYKEGYAAGSAEAQEELEDLLVCLGQEGRRVEKLRGMLAESGADIDAIIAEFEAEEEAEIAALVSGDKPHSEAEIEAETADVDDDPIETSIDAGDITLPEISQSLKEMAAEIETPERLRDYQSNLNADAEEFILPTPPKANHERANNNLERAFELA